MKYTSTRDATRTYTFEDALFLGYAPDGGLFVPEQLPDLFPEGGKGKSQILSEEWRGLGYLDLATEVLHPFLGVESIPKDTLRSILEDALSGFDTPDADLVPVVPLLDGACGDNGNGNGGGGGTRARCYVAELFHGPTFCFKDLGMRATIYLLEYFARNRGSGSAKGNKEYDKGDDKDKDNGSNDHENDTPSRVILTAATTGDTGPAAVRAVQDRNSPNLGIVVHYPEGQISDFQRKQMTCVESDRVRVVAFEGGGDDMDRPIKNILQSQSQSQSQSQQSGTTTTTNNNNVLVCGVNSYNIGRPLMQMVHFVWTYLRVVERIEKETGNSVDHDTFRLDVVVPTGAMGNLAGCYMAKTAGIPLGRLCAGVNANDFTHRAFTSGTIARPTPGEAMVPTLSEAINIQLPYNLERLLFYATGGDHDRIRNWYGQLELELESEPELNDNAKNNNDEKKKGGRFDLDPEFLAEFQSGFASARITDDELCATMRRVWDTAFTAFATKETEREPLQAFLRRRWIDPHTGVAVAAAGRLGYLGDALATGHESESPPNRSFHGADRVADADANANANANADADAHAVAIMATASPCKFQNAVTIALGQDRWDEYERDHFPSRGTELRDKIEVPPILYKAEPGKTLEENQVVWEAQTRALIEQLAS